MGFRYNWFLIDMLKIISSFIVYFAQRIRCLVTNQAASEEREKNKSRKLQISVTLAFKLNMAMSCVDKVASRLPRAVKVFALLKCKNTIVVVMYCSLLKQTVTRFFKENSNGENPIPQYIATLKKEGKQQVTSTT